MLTVFLHSLRRLMWQILGWGITFSLIALYLMALYKPMIEQQAELKSLFDAYGDTMLAFFGGGVDFLSPSGYLDFSFFSYFPVVAGIFAVIFGAGLLAADEEQGILDLVMAHPISRTALFWGRCLAFTAANLAILLLTWIGFVIGLPLADWEVGPWALLLPHIAILAVLLVFGMLALCLSMLLPSRALAASLSAGLMVMSYLVTSLARVNDQLGSLNNLSPLKYYQGGRALDGLDWANFCGLLAAALLFALAAWLLFLRRDIRVSGSR